MTIKLHVCDLLPNQTALISCENYSLMHETLLTFSISKCQHLFFQSAIIYSKNIFSLTINMSHLLYRWCEICASSLISGLLQLCFYTSLRAGLATPFISWKIDECVCVYNVHRSTKEEVVFLLTQFFCVFVAMGTRRCFRARASSWQWTGFGTKGCATSRCLFPCGERSSRDQTHPSQVL